MNDSPDVNTKAALLTAAIEVFADKGFDSATVRDICGRAKANVAAVNYHYGSKDGLYAAVLDEVFPSGEEWHAEDSQAVTPEERLREFLRRLGSEIYERDSKIMAQRWAIFLREMAKPSHKLGLIVEHQIQPRANALRSIVGDILGPDASDHALAYCSSSIWAMMLDHLLTQPILDRLTPQRPAVEGVSEEFLDHVATFAFGGLMAIKKRV